MSQLSSDTFAFHYSSGLGNYDSGHYWTGQTLGRISEGEVKDMLQEINAISKRINHRMVSALYWLLGKL